MKLKVRSESYHKVTVMMLIIWMTYGPNLKIKRSQTKISRIRAAHMRRATKIILLRALL